MTDWMQTSIKKKEYGKLRAISPSFSEFYGQQKTRLPLLLPAGRDFHYQPISHMGRERDKELVLRMMLSRGN